MRFLNDQMRQYIVYKQNNGLNYHHTWYSYRACWKKKQVFSLRFIVYTTYFNINIVCSSRTVISRYHFTRFLCGIYTEFGTFIIFSPPTFHAFISLLLPGVVWSILLLLITYKLLYLFGYDLYYS